MGLSLRQRFILIFVSIFAIGGAAGWRLVSWYSNDVVTVMGQQLAERNALFHKSQLTGLMTREVTLAQKMASSPVLKEWIANESDVKQRARAIAEIEDYRQYFRTQSSFLVIAKSGNYYFNDGKGDHPLGKPRYVLSTENLKDGWFYATLRNVKDVQLNVDTDRQLGLTRVWINTVVRDAKGDPVAVVGTGIDLSEFIAGVIRTQEGDSINLLMDEHGAIQAHQDVSLIDFASARKAETAELQNTFARLIADPTQVAQVDFAMQELKAGQRDARSLEIDLQGQRRLLGMVWIPEVRWFMVSLSSPSGMSRSSRLPIAAVVLIAILGLVVLVAAFTVERAVVRRLSRLDDATSKVAQGRLDFELDDESPDEIGRLSRAFASMAKHVASNTEDLKRQVAERTAALEELANTDPLTGLLNRRGMTGRLAHEMNRLQREGRKFALLHIDLDHFKSINDRFGHAAGDTVLEQVAKCLKANIRNYDACARWGGEEFLIALFDTSSVTELAAVAEKVRLSISTVVTESQGQFVSCSGSIGAVLADPDTDLDTLLVRADEACYQAKAAGRNTVIVSVI